jgi:hypothetical protein
MVFKISGGAADKEATITMVMGHKTKLGLWDLREGGGRPFPVVRSGKGEQQLTSKSFGLCDFGEVYILLRKRR